MTPLQSSSRDASFDTVRGALVLLMIVYHVMSIASTAGPEAYRYIRFISGSFIFITGFVITHFMRDAYDRDRGHVTRRLVVRGLKVLALFTALNIAIQVSGFGNAAKPPLGLAGFFENAASIYLVGDGSTTSFLILLPIAYLLLLAPAALHLARSRSGVAGLVLLTTLLLVSALPAVEGRWPVVDFLLVGLTGMAAGLPAISTRLLSVRSSGWVPVALGLAVALLLAGWLSEPLLAYSLGVAVILRLMHDLAGRLASEGLSTRLLVLLGQYSLLAYIGQIVLIQLVFRAAGGQRAPLGLGIVLQGVAVTALMTVLCVIVDRLRRRAPWCDRAYRLVFA